ncbi:hypothetical protein A6A04_05270 [Paramagnetospirillum marisnigri]|uniref:Uncharacterized protein n=1 Tax=Paramagnetospirillum marisnigri TaxID=1285242 RepID=A0A178MHH4_9PROT|nr:hypothetical protein [Paramagnetospirillum marisnigri]OAN48162.1 hypothetical protein A6A04_05270 [Paramagnetospirillum marisnigri]
MSNSNSQAAAGAVQDFRSKMMELVRAGDDKAALALAETSISEPGLVADVTCALAAIYYRAGGIGYAIKLLRSQVDSVSYPAEVPEILAVLYGLAGCLADAIYYAKLATTEEAANEVTPYFGPDFPKFTEILTQITAKPLLARGIAAMNMGDLEQAKFHVEQHLSVTSNDVEALDTYAQIQLLRGDTAEAIGMLRSIATLAGPSATLLSRLAHCLIKSGTAREGLACHQEAIARAPTSAAILGAAMADFRYFDGAEIKATGIAEAWAAQLAAAAPKTVRPAPKYAGASPIRICYLCSSLDTPELRAMVGAVAKAHDRSKVNVIGFGKGEADSPANYWTRGAFELWRDVSALDVTTMGALIRGEGVHVVIDADGLLAPAKSGLFQRNTAPLQINWLHLPVAGRAPGNYLACVVGREAGEGEIALASGRYCLGDPLGAAPVATPAPAVEAGTITFGTELSRAELTPRLAMVWGRILQAVPGSTLLFRDTGLFQDPPMVDEVVALFGNAGVSHRIDVVRGGSRAEFAASIDVALMPFPSADNLAFGEFLRGGAPVIALASEGVGADMGAFLAAAGLGESLVASDVAAYVAAASALAGNVAALSAMRAALPERLAAVPAFSPKGFAAMIEDAVTQALGRLQA